MSRRWIQAAKPEDETHLLHLAVVHVAMWSALAPGGRH
jgi:hypothetical protein